MTADQYRAAIERLGLSQVAAAKFLGIDPRTSRRWALGELAVPKSVSMLFRLMIKHKERPDIS